MATRLRRISYINDTKVITKIDYEENTFFLQDKMEDICNSETNNNMKYNGDKFRNFISGPNSSAIKEYTISFTLGFMEPMKLMETVKD